MSLESRKKEAIIVVRELECLDEYFIIGRYGRGKVIGFGNVNANVDYGTSPFIIYSKS